jgi:hypothetical protein
MTLGALIMMTTGVALFFSKPLFFWSNIFFRLKLVALVLALAQRDGVPLRHREEAGGWDTSPNTPARPSWRASRRSRCGPIVIVFGRFIAYNWFAPL